METPDTSVCSFFLARKKRFCKVPASSGKSFCPHHLHLDSEQNSGENVRIPCPLDPKHYCYLSKLEKHKKKCNAREKEKPSYFKQDINSLPFPCDSQKVFIDDITDEELLRLIEKVEKIYLAYAPPLKDSNTTNSLLEEEMRSASHVTSIKHLRQQASLLGLLEKYDLLTRSNCILEFGAGRGQLMYWIIKTIPDCAGKTFVLVDRETRRYKVDNKFKEDSKVHIERLRIDIQHLCLGEIEAVKQNPDSVVGVCKHLCGAATDLALKCLMETIKVGSDEQEIKKVPLGIVMSSCCHHRCVWDLYVGKEFILKHGISAREFKIMSIASSWATCGLRKRDNLNHSDVSTDNKMDIDEKTNRYVALNLSHARREEIGRQCKQLIDMGRVNYLKSFGMKSELVAYVDSTVSLENVALISIFES